MVGILVSSWEGPFSGAMLVLGRVMFAKIVDTFVCRSNRDYRNILTWIRGMFF